MLFAAPAQLLPSLVAFSPPTLRPATLSTLPASSSSHRGQWPCPCVAFGPTPLNARQLDAFADTGTDTEVHKCRVKGQITFNQATQMHSAGADLEIVDVNHGGDFLLSLHLLSVGLLLLGAAQRGWLEAFGVCLNLHLFSFPGGTDTRISPAGRRHYCLSGNR